MALVLNNKSLGKKAESEALDIISGADDVKLLQAGESFTGTILAIVVNLAGSLTSVIANDTTGTEIIGAGAGAEGYLNISGIDLAVGSFLKAGKYNKGHNWKTVETNTAEVYVYYKYTINRAA